MAKRIGILTAGGDAPALNVCLKAVVYKAIDRGYEVIGIRKGWEGLLHYDPENPETHAANAMIMTKSRIRDIDRAAGSFLHSSRLDPHHVSPEAVPPFLRPVKQVTQPVDLTDHVKRVLEKLQLETLVVLGDNAALNYAARLSGEGVPLIGVPKTVHNDVKGSDYSIGFSTALGRGVQCVHEVRAMAGSREEIAILEVLGRSTGLVTLLTSLLAGSDRTLIPEVPFDPETLASLLMEDKKLNPNNYAILTMSEAATVTPKKALELTAELSRWAKPSRLAQATAAKAQELGMEMGKRVSGSGAMVTEILENLTGQRFLFQPLSLLIRTAIPDGQDLLGAMNFATLAVNLLAAGKTGRLAAYRQKENYIDLPIETVTEPGGNINVADYYDATTYCPKPEILWTAQI
ncbi:MAG: phosphofructokinase [Anaerolineales bacterium]|nr:MAG: phosphofructokinase [Anaerolineales bacterium]